MVIFFTSLPTFFNPEATTGSVFLLALLILLKMLLLLRLLRDFVFAICIIIYIILYKDKYFIIYIK